MDNSLRELSTDFLRGPTPILPPGATVFMEIEASRASIGVGADVGNFAFQVIHTALTPASGTTEFEQDRAGP